MCRCEMESDTTAVGVGNKNQGLWTLNFEFWIVNFILYKTNNIGSIIIYRIGMRQGSLAMASEIRNPYLMSGISESLADFFS